MKDIIHVPVLDATLLEQLDPLIGDRQVHSIIEVHSSFLEGRCEQWVARNVFCDRETRRGQRMEQIIRHGEIGERVDVDLLMKSPRPYVAIEPEVVPIVAVESSVDRVIVVQNRGHSIEPEPVDMVHLNEVEELAEKELRDLLLPVVEALRIPQSMVSSLSRSKVLIIRSIKQVETVSSVARRMTTPQTEASSPPLDDIHDHVQSGFVDRIHESLG